MCSGTGIEFGERVLTAEIVTGRRVLEVGALDVNGSLRPHVTSLGPDGYLGVDIEAGPGVDEVVDAAELVERFGSESFDLVITTEMVEHTRDWVTVIDNMKRVLRPDGHLLLTTRSKGFRFHAYPYDFWRYEPDDLRRIFGDLEILAIERDPESPGVFMLARRPSAYVPSTPHIPLFSIITGRRARSVSDLRIRLYLIQYSAVTRLAPVRYGLRWQWRRLRNGIRVLRNRLWQALPAGARAFVRKAILRRA